MSKYRSTYKYTQLTDYNPKAVKTIMKCLTDNDMNCYDYDLFVITTKIEFIYNHRQRTDYKCNTTMQIINIIELIKDYDLLEYPEKIDTINFTSQSRKKKCTINGVRYNCLKEASEKLSVRLQIMYDIYDGKTSPDKLGKGTIFERGWS
jgi:hypothetical protein